MLRYLPFVLSLALTIYCLVDCIQTDDARVRNLPKIAWIILILLFPLVGPAAWLLAGRPARAASDANLTQQQRWEADRLRRERGRQQPPPRGPDDDPDFLEGI